MRNRLFVRLAALLLAAAVLPVSGRGGPLLALPVLPADSPASSLDAGLAELYNLKFDRARAEFERWMRDHPEDPLGPACRLAVYLFQELDRLRIPHGGLLPDTHAHPVPAADPPDPRLKAMFYEELRRATDQAQRTLARHSNDETALLSLTIIYATQADYLNLVEKRSWASLTLFKRSNRYAQQLLKRNPGAYDAWAASGLTEYLASRLPFYARWVIRFDSVKGDKKAAVEQLQRAAANGRYLRPYAKVLLAGLYLRERRPAEGLRVLKELNSEFPDNVMIAAELKRLNAQTRQP